MTGCGHTSDLPLVASIRDQLQITHTIVSRAPQLLRYSFFATEFGILKWNFHILFAIYFNVNYWNKMEFYVKFAIFSI